MSDQPPDDNARAQAESLVTAASASGSTPTEQGDRVSNSARQTIVDALTQDLNAASEHAGGRGGATGEDRNTDEGSRRSGHRHHRLQQKASVRPSRPSRTRCRAESIPKPPACESFRNLINCKQSDSSIAGARTRLNGLHPPTPSLQCRTVPPRLAPTAQVTGRRTGSSRICRHPTSNVCEPSFERSSSSPSRLSIDVTRPFKRCFS